MAVVEQFDFDRTRRPVRQARHAPGAIYSSPEIYAREKERIFMKDWLAVARVEELENPGDYMTLRIADEPVVIARDNAGNLNAFANVCAHRGVEVASGAGNTQTFSCPYHGWLYGLDGRLMGAPYMEGAQGFDLQNCRLRPIRLDEWQRWIFINFDPDAPPLGEFIAQFDADFGFLRHQDLRIATKITLEFDCNWKLLCENAMDNYHIAVLHPVTLGQGIEAEEVDFKLRARGGYAAFYRHTPRFNDGHSLFRMNMPSLDNEPEDYAAAGFIAPNFQTFVYCDNCEMLTCWPIAVDRCRLYIYLLFPEAVFDRSDFDEKIAHYREMDIITVDEDREMVQSLQQAMSSQLFQPGRMCHVEAPIHNLLNYYLDRMAL